MMKDNIKNLRNQLENTLANIIESNESVKLLVDSISENSDVSVYKAIINVVKELLPDKAIAITINMINFGVYPEKIMFELIELIDEYPYILGDSHDQFDAFSKTIGYFIVGHNNYSVDVLVSLANFLERLFAKGYKEIRKHIVNLYLVIPDSLTYSKDFQVHRELIAVYSYNGLNYSVLHEKLLQIHNKCRKGRMKHLYGEIFYYFAVLDLLSGHRSYYKDMSYIYHSCERGYELAEELQRSFSENKGGIRYE